MSSFTHLHVASCFSSHYGTNTPAELAARAAADGAGALALTDRDGLYGAAKHVSACLQHGLAPILGVDLAVQERGRVVVLASGSSSGYSALCQLISSAHKADPVSVPLQVLADAAAGHSGGPPSLYVLAGPESDLGQAAAVRGYRQTRALLRQWKQALGEALRVEVVSHLAPPGEALSTAHAVRLLNAAAVVGVAPVLTNAVRLLSAAEAATADVLDAVSALSDLNHVTGLQPNDQGWLKPPDQMRQLAEEICRASTSASVSPSRLLQSTEELAESCALDPEQHMTWGIPKIPEASVIGIDGDADEELRHRCQEGLGARLTEPAVRQRLDHELSIIADLGFAGYFLTVSEVARLIRSLGVRCAARGSGVSSLVVHALGISPIDPLAHGLVFERFLSRRRSTLPDIDIDVESAQRHMIYREVVKRFGDQRVVLMSMQNAYRIRGAVRDAGLALGLPEEEIAQLAEIMWRFPAKEFRQALTEKPELKRLAERIETERVSGRAQLDLLVDLTERLDRLPRHISTHPCGVILGDQNLLKLTPVQPSGVTGLPMSQFDKDDMDPMGFIKLDILGVRMQSAIAWAMDEIERTTGERIDLDAIDYTDPATYQLIQSTHTLGCFQIESPGQRELVGKLVPESMADLIIDISLFRPGPMVANMVEPFLNRRHGYEPVRYPHPDLAGILGETHGIVVFHEQIIRIFDRMTGCGLDAGDELRRKLGTERLPEVEEFFRTHAAEKGYDAATITSVWETLEGFGSFGFCKAHGAAFAVPTFQSAWLKTHYPAAFMCGLFQHDPGMYPLRLLVAEARRLGIPLLPMDVNTSTGDYRLERTETVPGAGHSPWGVRMALSRLKGISEAEVRRITREQPFDSLADLRDRANLRRSTLRDLVRAGALDSLLPGGRSRRKDLIAWVESTNLARSSRPQPKQALGQLPLPLPDMEVTQMPVEHGELSPRELVGSELELTGIDTSGHVMELHREELERQGVTYAKDLLEQRSGALVRVAGIRVATQTPPMRSGRRVVFISLDDGTGVVDLSFFDEAQATIGEALFTTKLMIAEGTIRRTGPRAVTVQATQAWDLHSD